MAQRILLGYVAVILIHGSPEDMPALGNVQILPKSNMGTEWLACTNPPLYSDLDSKACKAYPSL